MHLLLHALLAEHDPAKTRIVVFADIDRPAEISPELYWVRGDPTKESQLDKDRISRAAAVLVAGARGGPRQGGCRPDLGEDAPRLGRSWRLTCCRRDRKRG